MYFQEYVWGGKHYTVKYLVMHNEIGLVLLE